MGAQKKLLPLKAEKPDHSETIVQKAEIDRMKRLISEKIKDPSLARKAAQIISEMLNSKDS